jgi:hypothetical protein
MLSFMNAGFAMIQLAKQELSDSFSADLHA